MGRRGRACARVKRSAMRPRAPRHPQGPATKKSCPRFRHARAAFPAPGGTARRAYPVRRVQRAPKRPLGSVTLVTHLPPICRNCARRRTDAGLALAGVEPGGRAIETSRTLTGVAAGTAATAGLAVAEIAGEAAPAVGLARELSAIAPWLAITVLVIALALIAWARFDNWRRLGR